MPVPNSMADLATLASSNFPTGTESIGNNLDNYLRSHGAIIRSTNAVASSTVAAASTTDVGSADAEAVTVTGAASINSLGTGFAGCYREVRFLGACTLNSSGALVLAGNSSLTTVLGTVLAFRCTSPGVWSLCSTANTINLNGNQTVIGAKTFTDGLFVCGLRGQLSSSSDGYFSLVARNDAGTQSAIFQLRSTGAMELPGSVSCTTVTASGQLTGTQLQMTGTDGPLIYNGGAAVVIRTGPAASYKYFQVQSTGNVTTSADLAVAGAITAGGNITAGGDCISLSDERTKTDIAPISDAINIVRKLRGVSYNRDGRKHVGFIAQQVEEHLSEVVHVVDDRGYRGVNYGGVGAVLVEAIKNIDARLAAGGL